MVSAANVMADELPRAQRSHFEGLRIAQESIFHSHASEAANLHFVSVSIPTTTTILSTPAKYGGLLNPRTNVACPQHLPHASTKFDSHHSSDQNTNGIDTRLLPRRRYEHGNNNVLYGGVQ